MSSFYVSKRPECKQRLNLGTEHLGAISFAGREVLICVLVRCHTVVVRLVVVLAIATSAPDVLQDELYVICRPENAIYGVSGQRGSVSKARKQPTFGTGY